MNQLFLSLSLSLSFELLPRASANQLYCRGGVRGGGAVVVPISQSKAVGDINVYIAYLLYCIPHCAPPPHTKPLDQEQDNATAAQPRTGGAVPD